MLMSVLKNPQRLLLLIFIAVLLTSFAVHQHYRKVSKGLSILKQSTEGFEKKSKSSVTEDDVLGTELLSRISNMIPPVNFDHLHNTSCARNSRATVINAKDKYCIGDNLTIEIVMYDFIGNKKHYGGDFIRARIFNTKLAAGATGRIEDFNNGIYHVHFTLFWEGQVEVSLLLYHSSEAVSALWRSRNQGYGLIKFTGTFQNGNKNVKTKCGFQVDNAGETCTYEDTKYNELFYCSKTANLSCGSLAFLQSFNQDHSFFSYLQKSLFKRYIYMFWFLVSDIIVCCYIFIAIRTFPQEKCKIGMTSPYPSGFCLLDIWTPLFCRLSPFPSTNHVNSCLKDKMIYLMGDSTLRQWFLHLVNKLKNLKNFNLHRTGLESMLLAIDPEKNILLQWKKHSHPIVASRSYSVKDDAYISEEIDRLAGGPNTVIAITAGQHFRPFPIRLFIKRVINIRRALESLFIRSPETKVIIKAENTREFNLDVERFSDFYGYIQNLIVKEMFQDLPVAVVDAWDMTIAFNSNDVHPAENVIRNQINMFLTYIC
ncbi:NXPE family member 2 [Xenopus laevis]|uniref:NXPE family member 2 n=1 Tax=Xenopus laevis TaxID=8355 RepID=A0A8J1L5Z6_XENLA|nr:NXPE family member 2 [Xenopus laevis]